VSASDQLRSPDGRFRRGAAGDLSWLDNALTKARQRARAVDGPVPPPEPTTPASEPAPPPEPSQPAGRMIAAGPRGSLPTGDPIRDAIRRYQRHG
jgi:hypothetical protein